LSDASEPEKHECYCNLLIKIYIRYIDGIEDYCQYADYTGMQNTFIHSLKYAWSATHFPKDEITHFAQALGIEEARKGVISLSLVLLFLFSMESMFFYFFRFDKNYLYTVTLLALLSIHILLSTRAVNDTRTLYLLGTVLLMISGTAFVLLTHKAGTMDLSIFSGVILLFMVVPIVPWGLREALLVMSIIYGTFSTSFLLELNNQTLFTGNSQIDAKTVWTVLLVMVGTAVISLGIVGRNIIVRKNDIRNRYTLEQQNSELMRLSNKDPLTGAWNRRFLKNIFSKKTAEWHAASNTYHFAFMDMDNFKHMNDCYGHDYGDSVLRCLSLNFASKLQDNGFIIRMGGDEFALLFIDDDPEALVKDSLARTQKGMESHKEGNRLPIGISVGLVSISPGINPSQNDIYQLADSSLYRAKDRKTMYTGQANIIQCIAESDGMRQISVAS
jgi:diguanylate cyclase (GGDEF)-like protein